MDALYFSLMWYVEKKGIYNRFSHALLLNWELITFLEAPLKGGWNYFKIAQTKSFLFNSNFIFINVG